MSVVSHTVSVDSSTGGRVAVIASIVASVAVVASVVAGGAAAVVATAGLNFLVITLSHSFLTF